MTVGRFPTTRLRRNRHDGWTRRLVAENRLSVDDLIWPVFVIEGSGTETEVASMPGVKRVTLDRLAAHVGAGGRARHSRHRAVPGDAGREEGRRGQRGRATRTT